MRLLKTLFKYFNEQFRYPIIVFIDKKDIQSYLAMKNELKDYTVFFQTVLFQLPSYKCKDKIPITYDGFSLGYRHMCRFHSKGVYEQPILTGLDYAWRLDDDSEILRPIGYDVFEFMRGQNLSYGFVIQDADEWNVVQYLWETTCRFDTLSLVIYSYAQAAGIHRL